MVFTGRGEDAQDFTNNQRLLLRAIDKFNGRKLQGATIDRLAGRPREPRDRRRWGRATTSIEQERAFRARNAMSTIRKLAEFMAGVRGRRKAMLLIGEGVDYNIYEAVGMLGSTASSVLLDTHDAIAAATRGNVSIYAIDPRGLVTGGEDLITQSSTFPEQGAGLNSMQSELRLSQDSLRVLAANTGGFAAVNRNDLDGAFDRIVQENSSYYVLGFYSTNERRAGRYRKLEVRVKRPGPARRPLAQRLLRGARPPPEHAGAVDVAQCDAGRARGDDRQPAAGGRHPDEGVRRRLQGRGAERGGGAGRGDRRQRARLSSRRTGCSSSSSTWCTPPPTPGARCSRASGSTVNLTLKPDTYERAKEQRLPRAPQLNLPPGRYQMRVAASNRTGKAGSVLYDLDVPDFYKAPFAMSGVSLTSGAALQGPTIKAKDPLGDFLPGPPTATREFRSDDTLVLFAEFYENAGKTPAHALDLVAELRDEGGAVVRESREERSSTEVGGQRRLRLRSRGCRSRTSSQASTCCTSSGQSRLGDRPSASRDIAITIK